VNSPFSFGRAVRSDAFTDRESEIRRLTSNFQNGVNTTIISPRRWGKSSLVRKVADQARSKKIRIAMVDMFAVRSEEELYSALANAVIRATTNKAEEWIAMARKFIRHITPKFTMELGEGKNLGLTLDMDTVARHYRELLELPQKIASSKRIRLVICIDEFQNIGGFTDPMLVQKRLRSIWQHQDLVTYCLYGSRQHMMTELFTKQSNPFYRFGEIMMLPKIPEAKWVSYITRQFQRTGKRIDAETAAGIARSVDCHPFYVQQLSHITWLLSDPAATAAIVENAVAEMLGQNAMLYYRECEGLNNTEIRLLKAVAAGESKYTSADVVSRYRLGTSAGAVKARKGLVGKEILDDGPGELRFLDPAFALWFKRHILNDDGSIN
jgi:uncharacterized protein